MRKYLILGIGLLIVLLLIPDLAYASGLEDIKDGVQILKIGTGIILGFVVLGISATIGGWLLDVAQKQRVKVYMEATVYLVSIFVVITFFILVFMKLNEVTKL